MAEEYQMQISNRMLTTILFLASLQVVDFQLVAATAAYDLVVVDADTNLPIKGVNVVGWFSKQQWMESMDGVSA